MEEKKFLMTFSVQIQLVQLNNIRYPSATLTEKLIFVRNTFTIAVNENIAQRTVSCQTAINSPKRFGCGNQTIKNDNLEVRKIRFQFECNRRHKKRQKYDSVGINQFNDIKLF